MFKTWVKSLDMGFMTRYNGYEDAQMIVKIAEFRSNIATYLQVLEKENIYLTRHGEVIGVVCSPDAGERDKTPPSEIEICLHEIKVQVERLNQIMGESSNDK